MKYPGRGLMHGFASSLCALLLFIWPITRSAAQEIKRFNPDTVVTYHLDKEVVITARKISNEAFIKRIMADTSFYKSFQDMKRFSFTAENRIYTYDKQNRVDGKIYRKIRHNNHGPYRMQVLEKQDAGHIYKRNGKYELYTVEMFDYIFMNAYSSDFVKTGKAGGGSSGNEGYKEKLKTLIFAPGRPVKGIPFIGSKTEIFSANMRPYYNYSYTSGTYLDSIPVYIFKVQEKPDLSSWTKRGVMIKELTTIFDKRTLEILGRKVDMKYNSLAFSFDVQMNIETSYFGDFKLPTKITYQGNWDIPFKKEERASFLILHKDYKREK